MRPWHSLTPPIIAILAVLAQETPSQRRPAFGAESTAIVVDVVVRDKRGAPVTDLSLDDFELFEDGNRQLIGDISLNGRAGQAGSSSMRPAPPAVPSSSPTSTPATYTALVFDRLSPEARALAHKSALTFIAEREPTDFVGVFLSDLSLVTIQPYSNDQERLARAVTEVSTRATSNFQAIAGDGASPTNRSAGTQGPPDVGSRLAALAEGVWQMERDQQGYATTDALLAVVTSLGTLPGRKTVLFFAEGIALPDAIVPRLRNVVATANRANVAIYTIDAAGLRTESHQTEIGREVRRAGLRGVTLTADGSNLSSIGMMEMIEERVRSDPHTGLALLAEQTGGFVIDNTNDLANGIRRVVDDGRSSYLLTYTPKNQNFSGEWRQLRVRVQRPNVNVRTRSGYVAVRSVGAVPLLWHEGPALAILDQPAPVSDVRLRAAALVFPTARTDAIVAVIVTADATELTFQPTPDRYRTDFTILARIRDAQGEVVRKASQQYVLNGALGDLELARRGSILFYRQPTLPPGSYTLEAVVHDALGRRAGVTRQAFQVPTQDQGIRMSSLVVAARAERVPDGQADPGNPLYWGSILLYPSLGEAFKASAGAKLTFAFRVSATPATHLAAALQLRSNDATLWEAPLKLPPPDRDGVIGYLGQLPLSLPVGNYTLRATMIAAEQTQWSEAPFVVSQ